MAAADRAPSTGRARFAAASLLVALGVAVAATAAAQDPARAGTPYPDKTIPTLPPGSDEVPTTATNAATTVIDTAATESTVTRSTVTESSLTASSEPVVETGIPLRAGAGPSELFAAASSALNSTTDVATGLAGFAVIPTGIPTPAGSTITGISVSYSADLESYVAGAELTTSAEGEDVVTYYETVLVAEGFFLTLDETEGDVHELEFHRPESSDSVVRVLVDNTDAVTVDIEVTDHAEPAALEAFAGWPAGLPGLDVGRPTEARVTAARSGATTVTMSTTFAFEGTSVDALTAEIRDGVAGAGGGFHIAESDEGGTTITLEHPIINNVVAEVSDADGVTVLRVDGSLP